MNPLTFQLEITQNLDGQPFFTTNSCAPFNFSAGDEIDGDARRAYEDTVGNMSNGESLIVIKIRQYLFAPNGVLTARNLRIEVARRLKP